MKLVWVGLCLVAVLGITAAHAKEAPSLDATVEHLVGLHDAKRPILSDSTRGVDLWLLVDLLQAKGRTDVARAVASLAQTSERKALDDYLRLDRKVAPGERETLRKAGRLAEASKHDRVVELLGTVVSQELSVVQMRILAHRANAMLKVERRDEALGIFRDLADRAEAVGWQRMELRARRVLLDHARRREDTAELRRALRRLVVLDHEKVSVRESAAWCRLLGGLELRADRGLRAVGWLEEAIALLRGRLQTAPSTEPRLRALRSELLLAEASLGTALRMAARLAEAARALERAVARAVKIEHRELEAYAADELGTVSRMIGDLERANELHMRAATIAKSADPDWYPLYLGNAARALVEAGEFDRAQSLYERVRDLVAKADLQTRVTVRFHLAAVHLERARATGNDDALAQVLLELSAVARKLEEAMPKRPDLRPMYEDYRAFRAEMLNVMGRHRQAAETLLDIRDAPVASGQRERDAFVFAELANAYLGQGQAPKALATARQALAKIEERGRGLGEPLALKLRAEKRNRRAFATLVGSAIQTGAPSDVFSAVESTRAFALRMVERAASGPSSEARRAKFAAVDRVLEASRKHWRAVDDGARKPARAVRLELNDARRALRRAAAQWALEAAAEERERAPRLTLKQFRPILDPDERLLHFVAYAGHAYVLAISRDDATLRPLGDLSGLFEAVELAADRSKPSTKPLSKRLAALREALLPSVKGALHVFLCPDEHFETIPWSLVFGTGKGAVRWSLVPSANALLPMRAKEVVAPDGSKRHRVLAIGNPEYAETGDRVFVRTAGRRLSALPYSAKEIASIAGRKTDVALTKLDATEHELAKALAASTAFGALHFACHGLVNHADPYLSSLALTASEHDDGYLTVEEIQELERAPALVTLSACETGVGPWATGEGQVGLVRAFFQVGARQVIASLWRVDDRATSVLMRKFYEAWREGHAVPEALRRAQAMVRADPKHSHPYYWAGWVVWGTRN